MTDNRSSRGAGGQRPTGGGRRWLRGVLWTLGGLLGALLLLLGGMLVFLATDTGRATVAELVEDAASGPDSGLEIGALEGSLFDAFTLRDVTVKDAEGAWLKLDQVTLAWTPAALLDGTLRIERLAATRIEVLRPPHGGAEQEPEEPAVPGSLDPLPVELVLEELRIDEVVLGEALLGAEARLGIAGRLSARRPEGISSKLVIERTDGTRGRISFDALYRPDERTLDLALQAEEPAGGLIARLAGIPDLPPVSVTLQGEGPVATWRGKLTAEAGEAGSLESEIALSSLEPLAAKVSGELRPGALLPPDLAPLAAPETRFDIALSLSAGEALEVSSLRIEAPAGRIEGSGQFDLASGELQASLQVDPETAVVAEAFALPLLTRTLTIDLDAAGTLDSPQATVKIRGQDVAYQQATLDSLIGELSLAAREDGAWGLEGSGRFEGLSAPQLEGAESVTEAIDWSLQAELDSAFQRVSGVELALSGGGVEVSAEGAADVAELTGDGSLAVKVADLSIFSGLAGTPLSGTLDADAQLTSDGEGGATATLEAALSNFDSGNLALPASLGENIDLYAKAESEPGGAVILHSLELGGASFSLSAEGRAEPNTGALSGNYALQAEDLAPFSALAGTELAGSGSLTGALSGTLEAPEVTAQVRASNLQVAGQSFPQVSADIAAENLFAAPAGSAEFQARTPYGRISGSAAATVEGETLKVSELVLKTAEGESLSAEATLPLDGGPLNGTLRGRFPTLALVSTLAGQPLRGSGEITLELGGNVGGQTVKLSGGFQDLVLEQEGGAALQIQAVELDVTVRQNAEGYTLDATVGLQGVGTPEAVLDTARLTAQGALSGLEVTVEGSGKLRGGQQEALAFSTAARLDLSGPPQGRVERLTASVGERQARLNAPVSFKTSDGGFSLSGLDLAIGEGRLTGDAQFGKTVEASLDLSGLPLAFLQPFLPGPKASGQLSAQVSLSGSAAAPEGSFQVSLSDFQVERRFSGQLAPLALSVDGRLGGGRLTAEGTLSGFGDEAGDLSAELPLQLSFSPFAFAVPESEPISAALKWQGEVRPLMARLPVDDHRLEGEADIDLRLAGSLADPQLQGGVTLSDATYENFVAGTLLEDLEVELAAEGDRLTIRKLTASDGSGGEISGSGAFAVSQSADSEVSATMQFDEATVIRRDDLEATVSGDFSVEGDLSRLQLTGDLTGDKVEVRLVDNLPPSVTELQVTEINSVDPQWALPEQAEEEEQQVSTPMEIALDLDISLPRRVFIRGRGLDSEWEGEFRVEGTAANPSVRGQLRPLRGNFSFAGKIFELQEGNITLPGGSDLNPELDLSAVYSASNIEATVRIRGRADDPQFELSSTPPLPQEEIVSRILFERGTAQLTAAEAFQLSTALASLTGSGGPGILDQVRGVLGLDVLSFGAGEEGSLGEVKAGKYIADDIFVGVRQGATPQSTSAVVEVELTDNITVESENKASGATSVGVRWEWEY